MGNKLARHLLDLHRAEELLTVVNVWDAISARVVAETEGTQALATASHSIAASLGYPDGEKIGVDEMIAACQRIVDVTDLPVSADLEGGYDNAPEAVRKAIGVGVVGANIEDQMKPLRAAAGQVEDIMAAATSAGIPDFVLNARTDVYVRGAGRAANDLLAEAVERGRAYLDAGAPLVFVPGKLGEHEVTTLVEAFGPNRLTVIGSPGSLPLARLAELGVARVSYGPHAQRVALTALAELVEDVHAGGGLPDNVRPLN